MDTIEASSNQPDRIELPQTFSCWKLWANFLHCSNVVSKLIFDNFLLFSLFVAVLVALTCSIPGIYLANLNSNDIEIIPFTCYLLVFLISGMTLRIEDLKTIWDMKYIAFYGLVSINVVTTFTAFVTRLLPYYTPEFSLGNDA